MQPLHVQHDRADQPLMTTSWANSTAGYQDVDTGKSRTLWDPAIEWWHSLSPQRRTWVKRSVVLTAFSVAFVVVLLGGTSAARNRVNSNTGTGMIRKPVNTPGPSTGNGNHGIADQQDGTPNPSSPEQQPSGLDSTYDLCNWDSFNLPDVVVPLRYDLSMDVFFAPNSSATIPQGLQQPEVNNAELYITLRITKPTRCIVLHAHPSLKIESVEYAEDWEAEEMKQFLPDMEDKRVYRKAEQQLILMFSEILQPNVGAEQPTMTHEGASDEHDVAIMKIRYSYDLTYGLDGFYLSTYKDGNMDYNIASTQFEAVAARKAFPCFDEPRFKTRFSLGMRAPPGMTVLSNMPAESDNNYVFDGMQGYSFQLSPPMSTYLMAWVIGNFTSVTKQCDITTGEKGVTTTVPVSIYAAPNRAGMLGTALEAACVTLQTYTRTLGVMYSLPKLDLVALPEFAAGAMENWGLITYRETSLLIDPELSDVEQELRVNLTVAHEISHQWFGNLVTCADWNELWLNEGFATYFENIGADATNPRVGYLQYHFMADTTAAAMVEDSFESTHALSSSEPIKTLSQIDNYFDGISYSKGGAVLRMLRAYMSLGLANGAPFKAATNDPNNTPPVLTPVPVGVQESMGFSGADVIWTPVRKALRRLAGSRRLLQTQYVDPDKLVEIDDPVDPDEDHISMIPRPTWQTETFFAALKTYLETYAYQPVTHQQLWQSFKESTELPVDDWMNGWVEQPNYPVLNVAFNDKPYAQGYSYVVPVTVTQTPIVASKTCGDGQDGKSARWWIPIMISILNPTTMSAEMHLTTINTCQAQINVVMKYTPSQIIFVNTGRYGYYRVSYSQDGWRMVADQSTEPQLVSTADFAGSIDDAYRLMEANQLGIEPFVRLASIVGYRKEVEYLPWATVVSRWRRIRLLLDFAKNAVQAGGTAATDWGRCEQNLNTWVRGRMIASEIQNIDGLAWMVDPTDSQRKRQLRVMVLSAAGDAGDPTTLSQAAALMKTVWTSTRGNKPPNFSSIHPDLRSLVYCLALKNAQTDHDRNAWYHATKQVYLMTDDASEKGNLLAALTCVDGAAQHQDFLNMLTTPDVRLQDVGGALESLAFQNYAGFTAVWDFLLNDKSMNKLLSRWPDYGSASYSLGLAIRDVATMFMDTSRDAALNKFVGKYADLLDPNFMAVVTQYRDKNAAWLQSVGSQLCQRIAAITL